MKYHHVHSDVERAAVDHPQRISADPGKRPWRTRTDRTQGRPGLPTTPNKNLFGENCSCAFSHGCMRVENPEQYAEVLLSLSQPEEGYNVKRIHSLYGGDERSINLNKPIPVYITYQTAFVDDARRLQIRPDIYNWDKDIASLLRGDSKVADIPIHRDYGSNSKPVLAHIPTRRRNEFSEKRYEWEPGWEQTYFQRRSSHYGQIDHYRFW